MSQPKKSSKGSNSKIKVFGARKPAQVRRVMVPPEWMEFMNGLNVASLDGILHQGKPYDILFPCGKTFQMVFEEGLESVQITIVGADSIPSATVWFADQFSMGYPSYVFMSLVILAIAIEINYDSWDILEFEEPQVVNNFLLDTRIHGYPSDEVMRLFSSSGKPRFIKSNGYNAGHSSMDSLCLSLQGYQTLLVSIGKVPSSISEMEHLDLSNLPSTLVNALMGIVYSMILDERVLHASIGAHLEVGDLVRSRVPGGEVEPSNGS